MVSPSAFSGVELGLGDSLGVISGLRSSRFSRLITLMKWDSIFVLFSYLYLIFRKSHPSLMRTRRSKIWRRYI